MTKLNMLTKNYCCSDIHVHENGFKIQYVSLNTFSPKRGSADHMTVISIPSAIFPANCGSVHI